jgi:phosphoglycolate phosphatase-like HAD superfamily hydrolase
MLFPDFPRELIFNFGQLVECEEQRLLPSFAETILFKGCRELLTRLRERGIRLHIASTGSREHVFSILDGTGITGFFDTVSCEHPDKIRMLRKIIGDGEKNGYIMVGDMKKDYESARANGIASVGACYGYCRKDQMNFDFYISAPSDLLNFLSPLSSN